MKVYNWTLERRRKRRGRQRQLPVAGAAAAALLVLAAALSAAVPAQAVSAGAESTRAASAADSSGSPMRRCTRLAGLHVRDATVTAATVNASGSFTVPDDEGGRGERPPGWVFTGLPAYCRVQLTTTNPPEHDQIHHEVWLPLTTWNHRFQGVGGGGYVGGISYRSLSDALVAGYATASTDTGHPAIQSDGSFALDANGKLQHAEITDFAYRAIHEMTVAGKDVTKLFYGSTAGYSYFNGCSMGGRQGLAEAQLYPYDYNGIVAGAPAVDFARLAPAQLWPQFVMLRAHDFVPQCKFAAFQAAVVAKCDGLDGVTDGLIGDVPACHFDPRSLIGHATGCGVITKTDATVMAQIWQGPRTGGNGKGRFLWYGPQPGSDMRFLAASDETGGLPLYIAEGWFQYWLAQDPSFDWTTLTTKSYVDMFEQGMARFGELESDDADLGRFRAAGGKLLLWAGTTDPLIPPQGSIRYYESVARRSGGPHAADSFARLFLAPGVGHCGLTGNVGPVPTGQLDSVRAWVEHGAAPDTLTASGTGPSGHAMTRPVCAYPLIARYTGQGSTDEAVNFRCGRP